MKKTLLIGIAALAVLSLWLVVLFGHDSPTTNVSFMPPAYAADNTDNGGGGTLDGCTNSCLYDATISSMLPIYLDHCKMTMEVKHLEYNPLQCCCHTAATIILEVTQEDEECDCLIPMVMELDYTTSDQFPCDYGVYHSCGFVVRSLATYYYRIWDTADATSCTISGSYYVDCHEP